MGDIEIEVDDNRDSEDEVFVGDEVFTPGEAQPKDEVDERQITEDEDIENQEQQDPIPYTIHGNEDHYDRDEKGNLHLLLHTEESLPKRVKKFYKRRYQLYSLYDKGIHLTTELWFSVTPERVAEITARIIKHFIPDAVDVVDLCCGGGGNTIRFAKHFDHVGAIDINQININCTLHNAEIYEVRSKIWSVVGDWTELCNSSDWVPERIRHKKIPFDFIFVSPPWGGNQYDRDVFDLETLKPLGLKKLCYSLKKYSKNFGLFLPKSLNRDQIDRITRKLYGKKGKCRIIELYNDGHYVGILLLYGKKVTQPIDYHDLNDDDYQIETLSDYEAEMAEAEKAKNPQSEDIENSNDNSEMSE